MTDSKKLLGERLRAAREKKGLKQNRVALSLGIHNSTLAKYESGEREVDIETLNKLAEIYEVDPGYLISGSVEDHSTADLKKQTDDELLSLYHSVERAFGDIESLPEDEKQFIKDEIGQMPEQLRWKLENYRKAKEKFLEQKKK